MTRSSATLAALLLVATAGPAVADDDAPGPWDDCLDCTTRDWIMAEPGAGPEVGPLARVELGTVGVALDDVPGGRALTAGFARVRLAVGVRSSLGLRASATAQLLDAVPEPFPYVAGAASGGALALGLTQVLHTLPRGKLPLALTVDAELATGPAVRSGLGLRTLADGRRLTVAAGLASAWDFDVGAARAHARFLRSPDTTAMGPDAVELGVGASTRVNWARDFFGGAWPLEAWLDYRYRHGVGARTAVEHEVRGGFDYTPPRWLDRVGVQLAGTSDRLDDGGAARGLAMLITAQFGQGR